MSQPIEYIIKSEPEWSEKIPQIANSIGNKNVLLLDGELGSGKTTFVKYYLRYLCCDVLVDSPSFAIVNEYHCPALMARLGSPYVHHLDLYRITRTEELIEAGIEEMLFAPGLKLIEWPEIAEPLLPEDFTRLQFHYFNTGRKLLVL